MAVDATAPAPLPTLTPESIKRRRKLAEMMMAQGMDYSPIQSPWQGAARLAQGLIGGIQTGLADRAEREGQASAAEAVAKILAGEMGGAGGSAPVAAAAPAAEPGNRSLPTFASDVTGGINQATAKYGLDPNYLPITAAIESGGNPNARNPRSSAGGLFQFINSTAGQYGLTNKFDPAASADAAARLAMDNKKALVAALGREPTPAELYLAHQQGAGGAAKLLANPDAPAVSIVGEKAVRLNGGSPNMTAAQFANKWLSKFNSYGPRTQVASANPGFVPMPYDPSNGAPAKTMPYDPEAQPQSGLVKPAQQQTAGLSIEAVPPQGIPTEAPAAPQTPVQPGSLPSMAGGGQAMQMPPEGLQQVAQAVTQQTARPEVRQAAQQAAQTPQGQQMIQQAQGAPIAAIMQALQNPWLNDGQRSLLMFVLKERMQGQYGFQTLPDGTIVRTDARRGTIEPVYQAPVKPQALGNDQRLVDPNTGRVIVGPSSQARPMTEQERVQYGVPKGVPASFDNKGNPHFGAPGVRVDMSPGSGAQVFKEVSDRAEAARAAAESLPAFEEAVRLVNSGNIILGAGADMRVAMQKFGALFGLDATAASNSEVFRSAIAPTVLSLVKGLGAGSGISNADREFAEKAAGGNITLEPSSIKRLMEIGMRAARAKVESHNKMIDEIYPEGDDTRQVRSLFRVTPRQYVPPSVPEQQAQPQPQAQQTPPAQNAPVRVQSPADAQKLPPGTLYTTPDGRTFRR